MNKKKSFSLDDWWEEKLKDPEFKRMVEETIKDPTKSVLLSSYLKERLNDPELDPESRIKFEEFIARDEKEK